MNTNRLLRRVRLSGLYLFFGNTFLQAAFSIFMAFRIFEILGFDWIELPIFDILTFIMLLGFVLMFLGSMLQRKFKKPEIDAATLGAKAEFYEQQKTYGEPKTTGSRGTFKYFGIALAWFAITCVLYFLENVIDPGNPTGIFSILASGFFKYAIAIGSVAVAFLVALVSGNLNEDVFRLYIKGYHVHESIIGLYFTLIGGPLLWGSSLEFEIGIAFIAAGIFLVGRDWKDVVKGDLLVHKSREPDYADYMNLKKQQSRADQ